MDTRHQFRGERLINKALAGNPVMSGENRRDDRHREMCLAFWPRALMSRVTVGFIDDVEPNGSESLGQFGAYRIGDVHDEEVIKIGAFSSGFAALARQTSVRKPPRSSTT